MPGFPETAGALRGSLSGQGGYPRLYRSGGRAALPGCGAADPQGQPLPNGMRIRLPTCLRGAQTVTVVYRRRQADMTALAEEVQGAVAEGAQILELHAPVRIQTNEQNQVTVLVAQPKLIGLIGKDGRPKPSRSRREEVCLPCDVVIVAVGQGIETNRS